jgi:hypothetical protein
VFVQVPNPMLTLHVATLLHSLTSAHVALRPLPDALKPAPHVHA